MAMLNNKTALITGGGQGIGLGIARAFAAEGASLVITGRDAAKLRGVAAELSQRGAKVVTYTGDVKHKSNADGAVRAAMDAFGQLDILVNNAQAGIDRIPLETIDEHALRLAVESGLFGTLYHMQAAFPHLRDKGGSIINLGSAAGEVGLVSFGAYAATKEGIRGLSRVAAREWGKYRIRVNVLCPAALSSAAEAYMKKYPDAHAEFSKQMSLGYLGDPEQDIGRIATFLASDDSRYLTGQTLNADGGHVML